MPAVRWRRQFTTPPLGRDDLVTLVTTDLTSGGHRLETLTGEGGVGKSRLAVAVVERFDAERPDTRVVAVDLSNVHDPDGVPAALANALDLAGIDPLEEVTHALASEPTLLVLDSFEHLRGAGQTLARLLEKCPPLTLLVTSRAPLRLRAEHVVQVPPLAPRSDAAIDLFVRTALAAGAHLGDDVRPIAAEICEVVGGLPLAIELAAARTRMLPPAVLLDELRSSGPLLLLRGGTDDMPARHRGLESTLAWSHGLLTPGERRLLDTLAVARSWSTVDELLDLAERALDVSRSDALDDLTTLEHHGFLEMRHATATHVRLGPLVREFVLARADEDTRRAAEEALDRLLVAMARSIAFTGRAMAGVRPREITERRQDDLFAAFARLSALPSAGDAPTLALALAQVWERHSHPWRDAVLDRSATIAASAAGSPAADVAIAAWQQYFRARTSGRTDRADVEQRFDGLVERARHLPHSDVLLLVCELSIQGARFAWYWTTAARHAAIGMDITAGSGDRRAHASFAVWASMLSHVQRDYEQAERLARIALREAIEVGEPWVEIYAAMVLAQLPRDVVAPQGPTPAMTQIVELARSTGDPHLLVAPILALPLQLLLAGDVDGAIDAAAEALHLTSRLGQDDPRAMSLLMMCAIAIPCEDLRTCAILRGAIDGRLVALRSGLPPVLADVSNHIFDTARSRLGQERFDELVAHGMLMRSNEVNALAHDAAARWKAARTPADDDSPRLTAKELEVLACLTRGRTNKEIAKELGISTKTVGHHLGRIFRKLGVRNRAEAVRSALDAGLVGDRAER